MQHVPPLHHPLDLWLESTWFQPLRCKEKTWFQNVDFHECNLYRRYTMLQLAAHEVMRNNTTSAAATAGAGTPLSMYHAGEAKAALEALSRGDADNAASPALPAALVLSLLVTPRSEWLRIRRTALRAAVTHAAHEGVACIDSGDGGGGGGGGGDGGEGDDGGGDFDAAKPLLIFVGLVDKLHEQLKPRGSAGFAGGAAPAGVRGGAAGAVGAAGAPARRTLSMGGGDDVEGAGIDDDGDVGDGSGEENAATSPVAAVASEAASEAAESAATADAPPAPATAASSAAASVAASAAASAAASGSSSAASGSSSAASASACASASSTRTSAMAVVADVKAKLRDLPAMLECAKETLEWLEEADDAEVGAVQVQSSVTHSLKRMPD
jgi:hypothetical protein